MLPRLYAPEQHVTLAIFLNDFGDFSFELFVRIAFSQCLLTLAVFPTHVGRFQSLSRLFLCAIALGSLPHQFAPAATDESSRNGKLFLQRVDDKAGRILYPVALTRTHLRFEVLDRIA